MNNLSNKKQQETGDSSAAGTCDAAGCQNPATKQCSSCANVSYCSKDCQVGHWAAHKQACKAVRKEKSLLNSNLMTAVSSGNVNQARKLIQQGASAQCCELYLAGDAEKYITPLTVSVEANNRWMLRMLLEEGKADPNYMPMPENSGTNERSVSSPLIRASFAQNERMVMMLLEHNANVNQTNIPCKQSPLYIAVQEAGDKMEVINILLDAGANINAQTRLGGTPLWLACQFRNEKACKILLERGADPDVATVTKCTPLHMAVLVLSVPCVKLLIKHGAKLNKRDCNGFTPYSSLSLSEVSPYGYCPRAAKEIETLLRAAVESQVTESVQGLSLNAQVG